MFKENNLLLPICADRVLGDHYSKFDLNNVQGKQPAATNMRRSGLG